MRTYARYAEHFCTQQFIYDPKKRCWKFVWIEFDFCMWHWHRNAKCTMYWLIFLSRKSNEQFFRWRKSIKPFFLLIQVFSSKTWNLTAITCDCLSSYLHRNCITLLGQGRLISGVCTWILLLLFTCKSFKQFNVSVSAKHLSPFNCVLSEFEY